MTLYCATTNPGKLAEFRLAVGHFPGAVSIEPVPGLREIPPPEETGATFEENAIAKAVYYSHRAPGPLFADDSGLAVDALDGAPGILSARFAGPDATDERNNRLLLDRLSGVADRAARFVCVVALADRGELIRTFHGVVEGVLTHSPRGSNGFGYDPLFFFPPFGCTLAEVGSDRKMTVSHRGKALASMLGFLLDRRP
ncbi:MAG: RdgB/HAM1 family non-canonical purine NTP pyrophosphatase [Bryobacteraceae bacterium]|nr:RdgB/HAM1 family non-canonical purine NTP pyrophosphatase [Bryobacteraceae bacterium]